MLDKVIYSAIGKLTAASIACHMMLQANRDTTLALLLGCFTGVDWEDSREAYGKTFFQMNSCCHARVIIIATRGDCNYATQFHRR